MTDPDLKAQLTRIATQLELLPEIRGDVKALREDHAAQDVRIAGIEGEQKVLSTRMDAVERRQSVVERKSDKEGIKLGPKTIAALVAAVVAALGGVGYGGFGPGDSDAATVASEKPTDE